MLQNSPTPPAAPVTNKKAPKGFFGNWKAIATVIGLTLFFTGAIVAVIIVQRQRLVEGPVSPTAPESEPSAAAAIVTPDACALEFTVEAAAQPNAITCLKKELANVAYPAANRKVYTEATELKVGDSVFVLIDTNIGNKTGKVPATDEVIIRDELPLGMDFVKSIVGPKPEITQADCPAGCGPTVTYRLQAGTITTQVQFEAVITDDVELGKLVTNTATVISSQTSDSESECSADVSIEKLVAPGTVECIAKNAYTDFFTSVATNPGSVISANGSVLAGQEFVYSIIASASAATVADTIVTDTLPAGLTYVNKRTGDTQTQNYDPATRKLTVNLGKFTTDQLTKTVEFKVKANTDIAVGSFKNTATVNLSGAAASTVDSCDITLSTPARGAAICKTKQGLTNFTSLGGKQLPYKTDPAGSQVKVGDVFVYRLEVDTADLTSGAVKVVDVLPNEVEFVTDVNNTEGIQNSGQTVSIDLGVMGDTTANMTKFVEFKVRVKNTSSKSFINTAKVSTESNTSTSTCEHSATIVTPPPETPAPGCNERCTTNADCSNSAHICYTVATNDNRCRHENYPTSNSCNAPTATTPSVPTTPTTPSAPAQPSLPEELPVAGPEDWTNWLKAGLVTLGVGAILLLLL